MRPLLIVFIVVSSAAAVFAQKPADNSLVGIEHIYLAKDDGTGKAGDPVTVFSPGDIPIYCVVQLDSSTPATVKMDLVAAKVKGVKNDTKVVTVSYTTRNGQNRVNFTGKPAGKWVMGTYRVDIFIDNKFARNLTFVVKQPAPAVIESATLLQSRSEAGTVLPKRKN